MSGLPPSVRSLILEEQARPGTTFIEDVDVDAYLAKLGERAEFLANSSGGRCRGFVAFYANDEQSKRAYITLVLVAPEHRRTGLGRVLVSGVLDIVRRRGFTSCRLEVAKRNAAAHAMYRSLGFRVVEERSHKDLLEIAL